MGTIILIFIILSLLAIFTVDTIQKRRTYLIEGNKHGETHSCHQ